jgi:hypothetical protein
VTLPQRRAPIARSRGAMARTPIKRRGRPKSHTETRGTPAFNEWLHLQPPVCRHLPSLCFGGVHAAHLTPKNEKATGRKGHHRFIVPMCAYHHSCFDTYAGPFHAWTSDEREAWRVEAVRVTQRDWAAFSGEVPR